jgi:hypothetical protein
MFKWLKRRRERRLKEIAEAVHKELTGAQGWETFLPPVAIRDTLYMVTQNGSIYAMQLDHTSGMEQIIQIRRS